MDRRMCCLTGTSTLINNMDKKLTVGAAIVIIVAAMGADGLNDVEVAGNEFDNMAQYETWEEAKFDSFGETIDMEEGEVLGAILTWREYIELKKVPYYVKWLREFLRDNTVSHRDKQFVIEIFNKEFPNGSDDIRLLTSPVQTMARLILSNYPRIVPIDDIR
ncbi:MAG: hypothetical protein GY861_18400 [bacterium]|nr:hypothetical protein [bacterium]